MPRWSAFLGLLRASPTAVPRSHARGPALRGAIAAVEAQVGGGWARERSQTRGRPAAHQLRQGGTTGRRWRVSETR